MKLRTLAAIAAVMLLTLGGLMAQEQKAPANVEAAAKAPETMPLDETTSLKMQVVSANINAAQKEIESANLKIQMSQEQADKVLRAFMEAKKLKPEEWNIDLRTMTLTKRK